jgi:hypothetical protein
MPAELAIFTLSSMGIIISNNLELLMKDLVETYVLKSALTPVNG